MAVPCCISLFIFAFLAFFTQVFSLDLIAHKGRHFYTTIEKDHFFKGENNVQFTVSLAGKPDLPTWLNFEQEDPSSDAILYGTPDEDAGSVELGVIGWNKETYDTMKKPVYLTVAARDPKDKHPIELLVKNKDVADLLSNNGIDFLQTVSKIWPDAQYIRSLKKPTIAPSKDVNLVLPKKLIEGVLIGVTGNGAYPAEFISLRSNCSKGHSTKSSTETIFLNSGYDIDWCSFRNLDTDPDKSIPKFKFDEDMEFFKGDLITTKYDLERADLTIDIIYVFIAVLIGMVLIIFLTCLMCFNREGLRHRNKLTPKEQLLHHKSLRRAGAQLRNMSGNKDELNGGFPYGKLDEDSKTGTLSSNKPPTELESSPSPPPYRHGYDRVKRQDSKF